MKRVITFGTFDLFHIGHVELLRRARALGDFLIVGVSSDELNFSKKGIRPVYPLEHRLEIIRALRFVDEVFVEESLELKPEYVKKYHADLLVMGNDWTGRFDALKSLCEVVYLPRTPYVSSSDIKIVCRKAGSLADERFDPYIPAHDAARQNE